MSTVTPGKHAALRYTAMRVGIFALCFLVLWLLALVGVIGVEGATGVLLLLAIAGVLSAPISYVVLSRQRDAMSEEIVAKVAETKRKLAENRSMEDEAPAAAPPRGEPAQ
ncbi:DUF4229 domain-containing protein [Streptomyces capparidis]